MAQEKTQIKKIESSVKSTRNTNFRLNTSNSNELWRTQNVIDETNAMHNITCSNEFA